MQRVSNHPDYVFVDLDTETVLGSLSDDDLPF